MGQKNAGCRASRDIVPALYAVREVVDGSAELGSVSSPFMRFPLENWKRPRAEVATLMQLLKEYLNRELDNITRQNIRFRTIGRTDMLDASVTGRITEGYRAHLQNTGMIFNVALNYWRPG
jgi:undecaprenyl diphosphate synthase